MLVASALYIFMPDMLKILAKGLFGRVLGYAGIMLGFWLLFQGFSKPNPALGVLGGALILGAMSLMVAGAQTGFGTSAGPFNQRKGGRFH